MQYPKPEYKKHSHKQKGNPIPTADDLCWICGTAYAATHEIFFGKNKQLSIKYGMQVRLCTKHHTASPTGVHHNKQLDTQLKRMAQRNFEELHSRETFKRIFGKNYLEVGVSA